MYKLTNENTVQRLSDNAFIPFDPRNTDYQEYLEWVAAGNHPSVVYVVRRNSDNAEIQINSGADYQNYLTWLDNGSEPAGAYDLIRRADRKVIPVDEDNEDYQEYLRWAS